MRRTEPNAILAINSTDRYTTGQLAAPIAAPLFNFYSRNENNGDPLSATEFVLQYPNALIYGYIKSIIISQIQINYHIPTIVPNGNDRIFFEYSDNEPFFTTVVINLPFGFYSPDELAAMFQYVIRQQTPLVNLTVQYVNSVPGRPTYGYGNGFLINTNSNYVIKFPYANDPALFNTSRTELNKILRAYRLFGVLPTDAANDTITTFSPNFLYTDYIDICSASLTKYQKMKDSDTSATKRNNILARIYLSGNSQPQYTSQSLNFALGCEPFIFTQDMNTPKVIRWSADEAVYDLDFQLYDSYSEPLYWTRQYPTEFMITALCVEGEE